MADCCSSADCSTKNGPATKAPCPACQQPGLPVALRTLLHQLRFPYNQQLQGVTYYFCDNPDCNWVYFSADGHHYSQGQLRTAVGQKSHEPGRILCYCFDIRAQEVLDEQQHLGHSPSKAFVIQQTKNKLCDCETRNPSGRCCLKDFPDQAANTQR